MAREVRLALVGFGNVGRRFAEQLRGPYARALRAAGARVRVTGIATARHGVAIDPRGMDLGGRCGSPRAAARSGRFTVVVPWATCGSSSRACRPTCWSRSRRSTRAPASRPRVTCARRSRRGLHVVTANKGPVAFALRSLRALAERKGRLFLHEGAVMDGTPVFNLVARCLPGARIEGFRGTLNSTTNLVLSRMEQGLGRDAAVREAQRLGIAEADPRNDLDGWDAAVKGCALANALMGASVRPQQVRRRGIARRVPGRRAPGACMPALARASSCAACARGVACG